MLPVPRLPLMAVSAFVTLTTVTVLPGDNRYKRRKVGLLEFSSSRSPYIVDHSLSALLNTETTDSHTWTLDYQFEALLLTHSLIPSPPLSP
jgi:hypothetical protein